MWWSSFSKLKPLRVLRKCWSLFSILKTLRVIRKLWSRSLVLKKLMQWCCHFSVLKKLRVVRKGWSPFSALITLKVAAKWRSLFFIIKSSKSHKAVMELFLSFSLSFHMMHKFPGAIFSLWVPTEFPSLTIFLCVSSLISMKKDAEHISVNTARVKELLSYYTNKWFDIMSEADVSISVTQLFRTFSEIPAKESLC